MKGLPPVPMQTRRAIQLQAAPPLTSQSQSQSHPQQPQLDIELIDKPAALQALAPQWRSLLTSSAQRNLFLTPSWTAAWWHAFGAGAQLHLVVLRHGERLVGLMPLMLRRQRLRGLNLRVLGVFSNAHSSRSDLLVAPGYAAAAGAALARHCAARQGDWDSLWLHQIPQDAAWLPAFLETAKLLGLACGPLRPGHAKYCLPVTGTWDDYLAARGGHFRRGVGKVERRIERAGTVEYQHRKHADAGAPEFALFEQLEAQSWKAGPAPKTDATKQAQGARVEPVEQAEASAHLGPTGWAFQREFSTARADGLACDNWIVRLGGEAVAAVHTVAYDGVNYCFQTLFAESSRELYVGRAAVTRHFQSVFDSGQYRAIDFNGDSAFCQSWLGQPQAFVSFEAFNRRPLSQALRLLWQLRQKHSTPQPAAQKPVLSPAPEGSLQ